MGPPRSWTYMRSKVVCHRARIGSWRTVEADLAHAADEGVARAERRIPKVVAGDAVILVRQVLPVNREAPGFARGCESEAGVEQTVLRLVRHAGGGVRDLGEAAPVV